MASSELGTGKIGTEFRPNSLLSAGEITIKTIVFLDLVYIQSIPSYAKKNKNGTSIVCTLISEASQLPEDENFR